MDIDDIWNYFKNQTEKTIQKHIPTKLIRNKSRLPGVEFTRYNCWDVPVNVAKIKIATWLDK
jgi:hypothetical protein